MEKDEIKASVRKGYAKVAVQESSCCGQVSSCCGSASTHETISKSIGYTDEDMQIVPDGANLGLGCGNPIAIASLKEGEVVVDLGSGAGFDCFLAAKKVGDKGKVIGIDMTPEMIYKARENAQKGNYSNVEFRLGEIENLPVADNSADIIISNCVINLSPQKIMVFKEALRILKPGGRLMISDIVLLMDLPDFIKNSAEAYVSCISGAIKKDEYIQLVNEAGFLDIEILEEVSFPVDTMLNDSSIKAIVENFSVSLEELKEMGSSVLSINVKALKPDLEGYRE